jgi:hypothetical protein
VYSRPIRGLGHGASQSVHFPGQVSLADAPDGRIAAHLPQRVHAVGEQERAATHPRGSQRRLGTCVTAADHDDVEFVRMEHGNLRLPWEGSILFIRPLPHQFNPALMVRFAAVSGTGFTRDSAASDPRPVMRLRSHKSLSF